MKQIVELSIELEIEIDENESLEEFARNRLTYSVSSFPSSSGNLVSETGNYRVGRVEKQGDCIAITGDRLRK